MRLFGEVPAWSLEHSVEFFNENWLDELGESGIAGVGGLLSSSAQDKPVLLRGDTWVRLPIEGLAALEGGTWILFCDDGAFSYVRQDPSLMAHIAHVIEPEWEPPGGAGMDVLIQLLKWLAQGDAGVQSAIAALGDEDPNVRWTAADALKRLLPPNEASELIRRGEGSKSD